MCWRSSPDRERPMVRLRRSTAGLNICAGLLWGSVTSPTTSPGVCSSPVASDRFYTLNYDEPLCLSLPARASSVRLTDKFTVTGAKISGTIGSGSSISDSSSKKTVTVKHSKKKPAKKACINNANSGISFKGAITHVKQQVTGVVTYKNTKCTIQVGDQ